jgi:homoserine dehydrogenase
MAPEKKALNVAIAGLGRVGSTFLKKLLEKKSDSVNIVAAADIDKDAPGVKIAKENGIIVYNDGKEVARLGEEIDIIFDFMGNYHEKMALRGELALSDNQNTVVAPEVISFLIWDLIGGKEEFPELHLRKGY